MKKSKGQSLVEYALILALVAIVVIAALRAVGERANGTMTSVSENLPS
ncbi:MAG TPA: Flp family type IVb pilin [Candidatus Brocadiia bacterium]|nr:Flp family type IVb pilin [Candidatus Brocadiia bacterium]